MGRALDLPSDALSLDAAIPGFLWVWLVYLKNGAIMAMSSGLF